MGKQTERPLRDGGAPIGEGLFCVVFSVAGTSVGTHSESTCVGPELEVRLGEAPDEGPGSVF